MFPFNYCFLILNSKVHPSYKTRLCWNYPFCSRGGDCNFIHKEEERRGGTNSSSKERSNVARRMLNDKDVSFEVEDSSREDGKSKDEWSFNYGPKLDEGSKLLSEHDVFVKEVPASKFVIVKKGKMMIRGINELNNHNHMKDLLKKRILKV